ncbi:hypothetical protein JCM3770_005451 [Rhodotorula araucariae]
MSTPLCDLDAHGFCDTAYQDALSHGEGDGGLDGCYADPYLDADVGGLGDVYNDHGPEGGYGQPWAYEGGYYPDRWDDTTFVDRSWDHEQYALADLMHQLDLDQALDEAERLRRWEERLAWEELGAEARALRYREFAASGALGTLGLAGGWWGRKYGGWSYDLSYLREVPVSRGLFAPMYQSAFSRHPTLARRYSPYFSPQRLRAFGGIASMPIQPHLAAPYHSHRLSLADGTGLSIREQELRSRLRLAEVRASLTSLPPAQRAQALSDARRLHAQLASDARSARDLDRVERRADALDAARDVEIARAELRDEVEEERRLARLERAAEELSRRPVSGAYGSGYGLPRGEYY